MKSPKVKEVTGIGLLSGERHFVLVLTELRDVSAPYKLGDLAKVTWNNFTDSGFPEYYAHIGKGRYTKASFAEARTFVVQTLKNEGFEVEEL